MAHHRPSTKEDVGYMAPRLREADKREIRAATGLDPERGLLKCLEYGDPCLTMVGDRGEPFGIFGLTPDDAFSAAVWMLATESLTTYQVPFIRQGLKWVRSANTKYPLLHNIADARNGLHIRWLQRMGFVVLRPVVAGVEGRLFLEFVRIEPKGCATQQ